MSDGVLRPIASKPRRRRFSVYDLEWYPHDLRLRLVGCYDGTRYRRYLTVADFLNGELTPRNDGRWFYAHAGGLADFQFVLQYLIDRRGDDLRIDGAFSGSSCILAKVSKHAGYRLRDEADRMVRVPRWHHWYFLDSYWTLRQSLRSIGRWLGLEKGGETRRERCPIGAMRSRGETPTATASGQYAECRCDPIFFSPLDTLTDYNRQDCRILWEALATFEDTVLATGGELQKTVASTALDLFRRRFLSASIPTWDDLNEQARGAYIGSRVEVFRRECESAESYDINSSFPYAMTRPAPGALVGTSRRIPSGEEALYLARARVTVPETWLPPLGLRTRDGIYFPTGTWIAWFTSIDLRLLEEAGGTIDRVYEVKRFAPLFELRDYAETLYAIRTATDEEAPRAIYKILLNSLYGKFAEREEKEQLLINPESLACGHDPPHPSEGGFEPSCYEYLSAGIYLRTVDRAVPHAHVPIAAHITALARAELFRYLRTDAPDVYYCDTDGFVTAREHPIGTGLGELKHVATLRRGRFFAPKLHATQDEGGAWAVKAKGFPSLDYSEFARLADGEAVAVDRMARIRENLRRGRFVPVEASFEKAWRQSARPKRAPDGPEGTRPWRVEEL